MDTNENDVLHGIGVAIFLSAPVWFVVACVALT